MISFLKYITLTLFLFISISTSAQVDFTTIQNLISSGELEQADRSIDNALLSNVSEKDKIELYKTKGDIAKIEGDIDQAIVYWEKSNKIRSAIYKKKDYHLAWNYALLASYHYEKINTDLTIIYADSCANLIENLSLEQQKEIEIYKIWNILAQSYKQAYYSMKNYAGVNKKNTQYYYFSSIRPYYFKSIAFQIKYQTPIIDLATTYHLLANTYTDIAALEFKHSFNDGMKNYKKGFDYYGKSIQLLNEEYGEVHYRISLSYFVRSLLTFYSGDNISNQDSIMEADFVNAIKAFGIDGHISKQSLQKIPNKEDALMCLQHYTFFLEKKFKETEKIISLEKAEKINQKATELWLNIYKDFQSKNINQNLGIYGLVPFSEAIKIELLKKKHGLKWSLEKIWDANQKLKYFDFTKWQKTNLKNSVVTITALRNSLNEKECFVDFNTTASYIQIITKDSVWIKEIPTTIWSYIDTLNASILNFDYSNYIRFSQNLYTAIFGNLNYKKYILCADEKVSLLPFEALLVSAKNIKDDDYRKLDYLLNHARLQNVLTVASYLKEKKQKKLYNLAAFSPENSGKKLSALPFSKKMVEKIEDHKMGKKYIEDNATVNDFLNAQSPILHLSAHGLIDETNTLKSELIFSDYALRVQDVYDAESTQQLVVLNTCNSSLGKYRQGDGIDGFVRAFHAKGVPATLSNSWEVDDKASNALLFDFYELLQNENSTIDALQMAQKNSITNATSSQMASPYYWAGHRLVGEELVFEANKKPTSTHWWWIGGGLLVIGGLVLYFLLKDH